MSKDIKSTNDSHRYQVKSIPDGMDVTTCNDAQTIGTATTPAGAIQLATAASTQTRRRVVIWDNGGCLPCATYLGGHPHPLPVANAIQLSGKSSLFDFDDFAQSHCPGCGGLSQTKIQINRQWHVLPVSAYHQFLIASDIGCAC